MLGEPGREEVFGGPSASIAEAAEPGEPGSPFPLPMAFVGLPGLLPLGTAPSTHRCFSSFARTE